MNFNDLISSFVTLWALMVVNNWMVIVQMMCAVKDYDDTYRLYFIFFYYFSVVIGVNLFVAFVLDMYSAVERLEDEKYDTLEMIEKELKDAPDEKVEKLNKDLDEKQKKLEEAQRIIEV